MRASHWVWVLALAIGLPGLEGQSVKASSAPRTASASTEMERQVIAEMTLARTHPKHFAIFLHQLRDYYEGNLFREPGRITKRTFEGVRALDQAIAFLESAIPVGPLEWNETLFLAARDHARDQSRTAETGHVGSDGSTMAQRIERHGNWGGRIAENIDYGDSEARRIIINLIVDDGVASRGHRRNIFNKDLKVAGAAIASHRTYRHLCVIDFAAATEPKGGKR